VRLREYIAVLWADWVALMSGLASVLLAVWVVFFPPTDVYASRTLLWIATVACFLVSSYRIWASERNASLAKRVELEGVIAELRAQLDERIRRREIKEKLGLFLEQGKQLERLCNRELDPPPKKEVEEWDQEVGQWLLDNLGRGFAHRFYSAGELGTVEFLGFKSETHKHLFTDVRIRVTNLERFISELGIV
jgi:hypothetical protein